MKLLTYLQTHQHFSRRTITQWIKEEKVFVNGEKIEGFGFIIEDGDLVEVLGCLKKTPVQINDSQSEIHNSLILFNKPTGYVVSTSDPHNQTIYDILPEEYAYYYPIGRLDKESSGLLLLSNDPKLVHELSHPSKHHTKIYHITVHKLISEKDRQSMLDGLQVNHDGIPSPNNAKQLGYELLSFASIKNLGKGDYEITLSEGKNRHIRRLCKALGYRVERLMRIQFGEWKLGNLLIGQWKKILL